jgi:uncharacterized protein YndB with AHSA1/START domain
MAAPAGAEVKDASETGLALTFTHKVAAAPAEVWAALIRPSRWWSKDHSYSGDAKNFSMDPQTGGCFCERWAGGSVEHGRVVFAMPAQQLRILGAFGPLQGEALSGALTISLKADGKATLITADYVVGGYARFPLRQVAPMVDQVIGGQMKTLAGLFPPAN